MQKIKSFGSLSKNLTKLTKKKYLKTDEKSVQPVQQSQYENTQFYVRNDYQNVEDKSKTKIRSKTPKLGTKKDSTTEDPYQNTEFHSPRTTSTADQLDISSTSSPSISQQSQSDANTSTLTPSPANKMFTRKKSKSGKSFKSKFRKSLGPDTSINLGSSFNGTRSTFYISDSVDVDSGVFTNVSTVDAAKVTDDILTLPIKSIQVQEVADSKPNLDSVQKRTKRFSISPEVTQRKSSLTVRPNNPPPPPPVDKKSSALSYKTKRLGTTSWYAECGVFKSDTLKDPNQMDLIKNGSTYGGSSIGHQRKERANSSSWYADAGLYQTSGASVASSSGSSGVSTGGECNSADDNSHSMFLNEPLYQIYSAAKLEVILEFFFSFDFILNNTF